MNKYMQDALSDAYRKVLATDEGKRVFGSIFEVALINSVGKKSDFEQGIFSMGLMIANTIRGIDPLGVANCEKAYKQLKEMYENDGRDTDAGNEE